MLDCITARRRREEAAPRSRSISPGPDGAVHCGRSAWPAPDRCILPLRRRERNLLVVPKVPIHPLRGHPANCLLQTCYSARCERTGLHLETRTALLDRESPGRFRAQPRNIAGEREVRALQNLKTRQGQGRRTALHRLKLRRRPHPAVSGLASCQTRRLRNTGRHRKAWKGTQAYEPSGTFFARLPAEPDYPCETSRNALPTRLTPLSHVAILRGFQRSQIVGVWLSLARAQRSGR